MSASGGAPSEHWTDEGKLYLCAIEDMFSGRIVGHSISDWMKVRLAVNGLNNSVFRRRDAADCVVHSDRGSRLRSRKLAQTLNRHQLIGPMGIIGAAGGQRRDGVLLRPAAKERPGPQALAYPRRAPHCDHHLDRAGLPPPSSAGPPGTIDALRVTDDHEPDHQSGGLTVAGHDVVVTA